MAKARRRAGVGHTRELGHGLVPVLRVGQVVKRAEGEHSIEGAVGPSQEIAGLRLHDCFRISSHGRFGDFGVGDDQQGR